jgi:hypothetical protein
LDTGSARSNATNNKGQNKHRINTEMRASGGVQIHDPMFWREKKIRDLYLVVIAIGCFRSVARYQTWGLCE